MQQVPERALPAIRDVCCSSGRLEMERRFHKRCGWRVRHGGADGDLSPGLGSSRGESAGTEWKATVASEKDSQMSEAIIDYRNLLNPHRFRRVEIEGILQQRQSGDGNGNC